MTDVQFREESTLAARVAPSRVTKGKGMAGWLVEASWAKDNKQAEYVLIGVAVVAFAIMIFVLVSGFARPRIVEQTPLEQQAIPGPDGLPVRYAN